MGLDTERRAWKNRGMARGLIERIVERVQRSVKVNLKGNREAEDFELSNYREDMRGQLESLKKRGMPLRINTL